MKYLSDNIVSSIKNDSFFNLFQQLKYGEIHVKQDVSTGLLAIIAIHSTKLGPALGGCRYIPYESFHHAMVDALRLAHGMSYKAAICNLPLGGGKAVIMKPPTITDSTALFQVFGKFVDDLGGRYITAEDSGTSPKEMDIIRTVTPYVTGHSQHGFIHKDPSPLTALGVRRGIEAAVKHKLNRDSLEGLHVAIQGVGNVGYHVAKELHAKGATLTIADINITALERCQKDFNTTVCAIREIHKIKCDVFTPCALGNAINHHNIDEIQASIIAGSANNQLENDSIAIRLLEKGILYTPDYVINSGGLIHASAQYFNHDESIAKAQIENIYHILMDLFERAAAAQLSPLAIANHMAEQKLHLP